MSKNSKDFLAAAERVKNLLASPTNDELLCLYGLYKQAVEGDVTTERPGFFSFKEQKKWDAWNNYKGTQKSEAEIKYVQVVNMLIKRYGIKGN